MNKRTPEEVAELKAAWLADPYWVLEDTPGFEAHRAELRAYRLETHEKQEQEKQAKLRQLDGHYQAAEKTRNDEDKEN